MRRGRPVLVRVLGPGHLHRRVESAGKPATRRLPVNWHMPPLQRHMPSRGFSRALTGRPLSSSRSRRIWRGREKPQRDRAAAGGGVPRSGAGGEAEARREIERVLRRDSTDIRALYALAQLAGRSADPRERQRQETLLRLVLTRAPANVAARLELVDLLLARGAAADAAGELEALQRQLPQLPREAARFFERGLRFARAGRAAEAGG